MKAQQLAAELEVEMMADMYNRYEEHDYIVLCALAYIGLTLHGMYLDSKICNDNVKGFTTVSVTLTL